MKAKNTESNSTQVQFTQEEADTIYRAIERGKAILFADQQRASIGKVGSMAVELKTSNGLYGGVDQTLGNNDHGMSLLNYTIEVCDRDSFEILRKKGAQFNNKDVDGLGVLPIDMAISTYAKAPRKQDMPKEFHKQKEYIDNLDPILEATIAESDLQSLKHSRYTDMVGNETALHLISKYDKRFYEKMGLQGLQSKKDIDPKYARKVLDRVAELDKETPLADYVAVQNKNGCTAIHQLAYTGAIEVLKEVMGHEKLTAQDKIDLIKQNDNSYQSPLTYAKGQRNLDVVRYFEKTSRESEKELGLSEGASSKKSEKENPDRVVFEKEDAEILAGSLRKYRHLFSGPQLQYTGDVQKVDGMISQLEDNNVLEGGVNQTLGHNKTGLTILNFAIGIYDKDAFAVLKRNGAEFNDRGLSTSGKTPLDMAMTTHANSKDRLYERKKITKAILDKTIAESDIGILSNTREEYKEDISKGEHSALHMMGIFAKGEMQPQYVKKVVDRVRDLQPDKPIADFIGAQNAAGLTAIHFMAFQGHGDLLKEVLSSRGLSSQDKLRLVEQRDNSGNKAIDYAELKENKDVVRFLNTVKQEAEADIGKRAENKSVKSTARSEEQKSAKSQSVFEKVLEEAKKKSKKKKKKGKNSQAEAENKDLESKETKDTAPETVITKEPDIESLAEELYQAVTNGNFAKKDFINLQGKINRYITEKEDGNFEEFDKFLANKKTDDGETYKDAIIDELDDPFYAKPFYSDVKKWVKGEAGRPKKIEPREPTPTVVEPIEEEASLVSSVKSSPREKTSQISTSEPEPKEAIKEVPIEPAITSAPVKEISVQQGVMNLVIKTGGSLSDSTLTESDEQRIKAETEQKGFKAILAERRADESVYEASPKQPEPTLTSPQSLQGEGSSFRPYQNNNGMSNFVPMQQEQYMQPPTGYVENQEGGHYEIPPMPLPMPNQFQGQMPPFGYNGGFPPDYYGQMQPPPPPQYPPMAMGYVPPLPADYFAVQQPPVQYQPDPQYAYVQGYAMPPVEDMNYGYMPPPPMPANDFAQPNLPEKKEQAYRDRIGDLQYALGATVEEKNVYLAALRQRHEGYSDGQTNSSGSVQDILSQGSRSHAERADNSSGVKRR